MDFLALVLFLICSFWLGISSFLGLGFFHMLSLLKKNLLLLLLLIMGMYMSLWSPETLVPDFQMVVML